MGFISTPIVPNKRGVRVGVVGKLDTLCLSVVRAIYQRVRPVKSLSLSLSDPFSVWSGTIAAESAVIIKK